MEAGRMADADHLARVVDAQSEIGIDASEAYPKPLTAELVEAADVVTMGCGDACPVFPGRRYLDWELPDPAGLELPAVRAIRDAVGVLVDDLVAELRTPEVVR
jgi:arsenate reductase (thioredoxin)